MFSSVAKRALVNSIEELVLNNTKPLNIILLLSLNEGRGPYENVIVEKIECINHVGKRMPNRLKKLREEEKEEKITKSGKTRRTSTLGGRYKLSDTNISLMTSYYIKAIRNNIGNPWLDMKKRDYGYILPCL